LTKQREAHQNGIATLHQHINDIQRGQIARQRTPSPTLEDVKESQVGGQPLKIAKIDLGGTFKNNS